MSSGLNKLHKHLKLNGSCSVHFILHGDIVSAHTHARTHARTRTHAHIHTHTHTHRVKGELTLPFGACVPTLEMFCRKIIK